MPKRIIVCPLFRIRPSPIVVDFVVDLNDLTVKGDWGASMRRGHGNYSIDGVGLVVGLNKHRSSNNTAHGVTQNNDGSGIREIRSSGSPLRVGVEGEDVPHGFVEILGLV